MSFISITSSTTKVTRGEARAYNAARVEAVPADAEGTDMESFSSNDLIKALFELGTNKRCLYKHSNERARAIFASRFVSCKLRNRRLAKGQYVSDIALAQEVYASIKAGIKAANKMHYRLPLQVMRASCARAVALRTFTPRASARQTHKQTTKHKDDSGGTGSDSDSASSNDLLLYYLIRIRPRPARHRATCTSRKLESAAAMPHCPYKKEVQQS